MLTKTASRSDVFTTLAAKNCAVFVVMELKVKEDDAMSMQALEYLDSINERVDRFASFYICGVIFVDDIC